MKSLYNDNFNDFMFHANSVIIIYFSSQLLIICDRKRKSRLIEKYKKYFAVYIDNN